MSGVFPISYEYDRLVYSSRVVRNRDDCMHTSAMFTLFGSLEDI